VSKWVLKFLQGDNGSVGGGAASSQVTLHSSIFNPFPILSSLYFMFEKVLSGPIAYDSMSFTDGASWLARTQGSGGYTNYNANGYNTNGYNGYGSSLGGATNPPSAGSSVGSRYPSTRLPYIFHCSYLPTGTNLSLLAFLRSLMLFDRVLPCL
jgi:hypothetical protein